MILTQMVIADSPTCAIANAEVTVTQAATPGYPDSAKDLGLGRMTVLVLVTVNADGSLVDARIQQSSHNAALDQAALRAARDSDYAPKIVNCQAATGTYILRADMDPANAPQQYVGCRTPNRPPTVAAAVAPVVPGPPKTFTEPVVVRVLVIVGPDGTMQGTRIIQSSGDPAIDAGALVAAQMSRYTPQMLACVPVRGTLVVSEKFGP